MTIWSVSLHIPTRRGPNDAVPSSAQQWASLDTRPLSSRNLMRSGAAAPPTAGALHVLVPASNAIVPASVMTRYALMAASMTVGQVIGVFATLSF
jgi:hypothetical protein